MRYPVLFIAVMLLAKVVTAQAGTEFKEGQALNIEGVEFIYTLGVEEVKTIDGAQYSFFNVDWYVTNKGKFSKVFLLEKEKIVANPEYDLTKKAYLGKIHVINGLQLPTTKKFDIISSEANMEILVYSKSLIGNKRKTLEGFNLQSGQTVTSSLVVAVPKGQRPVISLQPFISPFY
jgi:hypothetical protein